MTSLGLTFGWRGRGLGAVSNVFLGLALATSCGLLLLCLGLLHALDGRADRAAWTDLSLATQAPISSETVPGVTYITVGTDYFSGNPIEFVQLASTGGDAPVPPGIPELPGPGEVLVSPALSADMAESDVLQARYGEVIGLVGDSALEGPSARMAIRGIPLAEAQLSGSPIRGFAESVSGVRYPDSATVLLGLGAVAILALAVALASILARLGNEQRALRLARLRLAGASMRQIRAIAVLERASFIVLGLAIGGGAFLAVRPLAAGLPLGGSPFFVEDVMPDLLGWLVTLLVTAGVGLLVSQLDVPSMVNDPDSTVRQANRDDVSVTRLIPLAILIAVVSLLASGDAMSALPGGRSVIVPIFFAVSLFGIVLAGPWIARVTGKVLASGGGVWRLLSGTRLIHRPRSSARASFGLTAALMTTACFGALAPSAYADLSDDTVIGQRADSAQLSVADGTAQQSATLLAALERIGGITAAALVTEATISIPGTSGVVWVGDCRDIVAAARQTGVPCGTAPVLVAENRAAQGLDPTSGVELYNMQTVDSIGANAARLNPTSGSYNLQVEMFSTMPSNTAADSPDMIVEPSAINGLFSDLRPSLVLISYTDPAALELARNAALRTVPNSGVTTRQVSYDNFNLELRRIKGLIDAGIPVVAVLTGLTLIAMTWSGLVERRRPFTSMVAVGCPRRVVRASLFIEVVAPTAVLAITASAVGAGLGAALASQAPSLDVVIGAWLRPLGAGLALALLAGSAASLLASRVVDLEGTLDR